MPVDFFVKRRLAARLKNEPHRFGGTAAEHLADRAQGRLLKQPFGARSLCNDVSVGGYQKQDCIVCIQHLKDSI